MAPQGGVCHMPGMTVWVVRERWIHAPQPPLVRSRVALARVLAAGFPEDDPRERIVVALLDRHRRLLGLHTLTIGCLTGATVDPGAMLRLALLVDAGFIGVAHNHCSSGDPTPSKLDEDLTHTLSQAAAVLGIALVDHIVFGRGMCWMSVREWLESGGVRHAALRGTKVRR